MGAKKDPKKDAKTPSKTPKKKEGGGGKAKKKKWSKGKTRCGRDGSSVWAPIDLFCIQGQVEQLGAVRQGHLWQVVQGGPHLQAHHTLHRVREAKGVQAE